MASLALGVRFNPVAAGTVDFVYSSTVTGYRAATVLTNGKVYRYRAESTDLSEWEFGTGIWSSATNTLSRNTVDFSSTGAKVSFTLAPQVAITIAPADVLAFDDAMSLTDAQKAQAQSNLGIWNTGNARLTFTTAAAPGWIMLDDGSIGNGSSGATTRANSDTSALFTTLYNAIAALVVQDSAGSTVARGASAAADFAANRRLVLPKVLGRALAVAGAGSGLTSRLLGAVLGEESHTMTAAEMFAHTHTFSATTGTESADHTHSISGDSSGIGTGVIGMRGSSVNSSLSTGGRSAAHTHNVSGTTASAGSSSAFNVMQPTTFLNVEVKL